MSQFVDSLIRPFRTALSDVDMPYSKKEIEKTF